MQPRRADQTGLSYSEHSASQESAGTSASTLGGDARAKRVLWRYTAGRPRRLARTDLLSREHAARELCLEIATAASITLIAQCLIPAFLAAPKPLRTRFAGGATDTAFAPPLDYFRYVFLPPLRSVGIDVITHVTRRGYYPTGGSDVTIEVEPAKPRPIIAIQRGELRRIRILSSAAAILKRRQVAERQIEGALPLLASVAAVPETSVEYADSVSAGSAACIVAEFEASSIGASALGARGKLAEQVGEEAARQFLTVLESPACLDPHMADQVLPYMALAASGSRVTVTDITAHCRTNMWVIEKFLPGKFKVRRSHNLVEALRTLTCGNHCKSLFDATKAIRSELADRHAIGREAQP